MRPGTEHKPIWETATPAQIGVVDRDHLRERIHRVILGAGYTEEAAQSILLQYFEKYLQDIPNFLRMLISYESGHGDD